ncbi:MAG: hypothetical protein K8S24_01375 [Candidatus Aegiribacteria sp.]|nr:hypothetical protein [Candidatus Aegiribacteria sp.]
MTSSIDGGESENDLERRIADTGSMLAATLGKVIEQIPGNPHGPQTLARLLGINKVLTSRILKALRSRDSIAVMHHIPGPEPLRRFLRHAGRHVAGTDVIDAALNAVDQFDLLIRQETGDRASLNAIISAWLPEARRDFELRRKQAAFRAMSELKGVLVETNLATVILHPSDGGDKIDIVWIIGQLGLQRLRPGATIKLATRRITEDVDTPRVPLNLEGKPIKTLNDARLESFSTSSDDAISVNMVSDVIHYTLKNGSFGRASIVDIVLAEVNPAEMPRYVEAELNRKGYVFADINLPSRLLLFDVLVHEDIYPGADPQLLIYDTAFNGVADINDPSRDIDRIESLEVIRSLGTGSAKCRNTNVPRYVELLRSVFSHLQWNDLEFRGYRCAIDFPVYGTQVVMTFVPPPPPEGQPENEL